ncbi:MAG TPA: carboxypeptidase-like regulatory domain-containing protein, partial [Ohtaekwangia sp.]
MAWAQGVTTASIAGTVVDQNGEPLPGANVIAVHVPSGTEYGASSLADGRFNMPAVRIGGPYRITVSFIGYENSVQENVYLSLGQSFNVKVDLKESGTQLAEIVVTSSSIINSDRTGASTNINTNQLMRMPTLSRSFTDMTRLTPQASGTSFAGRNNLYNNLSIDGSLFNNSFGLASLPGGQTNSQPISLDALEEITVNIAPYDVRQGGFTGAGINAVTRSGT